MVSKIYLLFTAVQLVYVLAFEYDYELDEYDLEQYKVNLDINTNPIYRAANLQKIRNEMFWRMSLYTQGLWNVTPEDQNIQFSPILDAINTNLALMYIYHQDGLASLFSKNRFLELPVELARTLYKIRTSPRTRLYFYNAVFFTRNYTKINYLRDVASYYHHFIKDMGPIGDPETPALWLAVNTRDRDVEKENSVTPGFNDYHVATMLYCAYWDIRMVKSEDLLFDLGRRLDEGHRSYATMLKFPMTNFENQTKLYVESFTSSGSIGYFNDTWSGYEAISLPYADDEFAAAIVLPHRNQTLKMFVNFTAQDYQQLFERVSSNFQHIQFIIPSLRISMVSMNEWKTDINDMQRHPCPLPKYSRGRPKTPKSSDKKFVVDRPYGVFIYHKHTKFVFWQGWIRDPTSTEYVLRRFFNHTSAMAREFDLKYIS